jgi:hypothetical protein
MGFAVAMFAIDLIPKTAIARPTTKCPPPATLVFHKIACYRRSWLKLKSFEHFTKAQKSSPTRPLSSALRFSRLPSLELLSEQLSTETAHDFAKLNRQIRELKHLVTRRKQSPANCSNRQKIQFRNTGNLNAKDLNLPSRPRRKRSQDPALLTATGRQTEFLRTPRKQTTGKFLTGARMQIGDFANPRFSAPQIATLLFPGFRVRRGCRGLQIRISFRRTT